MRECGRGGAVGRDREWGGTGRPAQGGCSRRDHRALRARGSEGAGSGASRWWGNAGCVAGGAEDLERGAVAEHLAGAVVEAVGGVLEEAGVEGAEIRGFGDELAEQAVGVFVEAAFPGVVGAGEEDIGGEGGGDGAVTGELLAVVEGEGVHEGVKGASRFWAAPPTSAAVRLVSA